MRLARRNGIMIYKVDTETQQVVITLAFLLHKDVPMSVASDALQHLWESSVRQSMIDTVGWIEKMQGPIYDSSVMIDLQYESIENFLKNYKEDEIAFREAFKAELGDSMERYFRQKLLQIIHGDLEDHMIITQSPVAQDELVKTEKRLYEVELEYF